MANMDRVGLILMKIMMLLLFCSCSSTDGVKEVYTRYKNHDNYMKSCDLSMVYPYSDYMGKTIYLQRNTTLYCSKSLHFPFQFYIDGTSEPSNGGKPGGYYQVHNILLKKGLPLKIVKIFSNYSVSISHDEKKELQKNNSLTAFVEFELPEEVAKFLDEKFHFKETMITAEYGWLLEGGDANRRTCVTTSIRRAPWEPDSVPIERYVGILGDEMEQSKK